MNRIDDGFRSWLVGAADFESLLDMPRLALPKRMEIPRNLIPFSRAAYTKDFSEYIHFYEHDTVFRDFLENTEQYVQALYRFPGILTPDCSLYRDMPLILQLCNTYTRTSTKMFRSIR